MRHGVSNPQYNKPLMDCLKLIFVHPIVRGYLITLTVNSMSMNVVRF